MANQEHLAILRQGAEAWNAWRREHPDVRPDFSGSVLSGAVLSRANLSRTNLRDATLHKAKLQRADLISADLRDAKLLGATLTKAYLQEADLRNANLRDAILVEADYSGADLREAYLRDAELSEASLREANLSGAVLTKAYLHGADLRGANLSGAHLVEAQFNEAYLHGANLSGANLSGAYLHEANLSRADLSRADLSRAEFYRARLDHTVFATVDLSKVKGLDTVWHDGPSAISIDTWYLSHGNVPEAFLQGCGVHDTLIKHLLSLRDTMQPVQFYSCFISYSSQDQDFARRLYERMRDEHLRVWFAPEDMQGGRKLHEQVEEAIRLYDKVLVILSTQGRQSKWLMNELRQARKDELQMNRRKLFPVCLMPMEVLQTWECIDPETDKDIADEVRAYYIPDFSDWKNHDAFERAFARLLRDLKAVDQRPAPAPAHVATPAPPSGATVLSQEDIAGQQTLLATHRRTLAHYLQRLGILTTAHAPPELAHGIEEARTNIARVKGILRASGVQVADHPDDTDD
jgi:uncharacterized protein YjbI with pentapeptide repeats